MRLNLKIEWIRELGNKVLAEEVTWGGADQWRSLEIERFKDADLDQLLVLMQKREEAGIQGAVAVKRKILTYRKLLLNANGVRISKLETLSAAFKILIEPLPHKWLFTENKDGYLVPWYVYDIQNYPFDKRSGCAAHTKVSLAAFQRGRKITDTIRYEQHDLGHTACELLRKRGYFMETPEILGDYAEENRRYQAICGLTGEQFLAVGESFEQDSMWLSGMMAMERDQQPSRVVMDDKSDEGESREQGHTSISAQFWANKKEQDNSEGDESAAHLPIQPYVKIFNLNRHDFRVIHVGNLTEYVYDATLIDKLILPHDDKELILMLVSGASILLEDIVKGKTGGIIVVCTGPPGCGKTLSAEVFSEEVKRPLYSVQCSQLGTNEQALEKKLNEVLERAQRWKAILLIDEADVYVHERGNDIQQNAIVGVFLRVLEYYRGILFMTSNRETVIDDAIMSRATAWIRYDIPEADRAIAIWLVLLKQYKAELRATDIKALAEKFSSISGRSIKNLLKLATLLSARKQEPVTVSSIEYVSRFLDLENATRDSRSRTAAQVGDRENHPQ